MRERERRIEKAIERKPEREREDNRWEVNCIRKRGREYY